MDIDCFVYPGWQPRLRPAIRRRDWMDASPEAFAYRCLPLAMANAHGWEIANAGGFAARWTGGGAPGAVEIRPDRDGAPGIPVALFGQATLTFHVEGLFRTPPGWNLWLGGPPNAAKDGIAPLGGLIETDWSPYSFTMNWRFTRPDHWVRFEPGEAIGFFFPVERGIVDRTRPRLRDIAEAPDLKRQFEAWSASRDAFHARMREAPPTAPADKWQKLYYRGVDVDGVAAPGHQTRLRAPDFAITRDAVTGGICPARPTSAAPDRMAEIRTRLRALSPLAARIRRYHRIAAADFLHDHYAANLPALLAGEMADWPALRRCSRDHLAALIGDRMVEVTRGDGRSSTAEAGLRMAFDRFVTDAGIGGRVATRGCAVNEAALAPMRAGLGPVDRLLVPAPDGSDGDLAILHAGAITSVRWQPVNLLLAQIVGRQAVVIAPPGDGPIDAPGGGDETAWSLTLEAGEMLFVPVGWRYRTTAPDFAASVGYARFRWWNCCDDEDMPKG